MVLITGVSRGIGKAAALQMAAQGARVYGCARSETLDLGTADSSIQYQSLDLVDGSSVSAWVDSIGEKEGRIDVVINNAGILGPRKELDQIEASEFQETLEVNVLGTYHVLRAAYRWLKKSSLPRVINLSSSVGRKGRAQWGAYSVSKFAVEGLTEVAADELGAANGVVVSLNPGGTATDMRAEAYPDEDQATLPSAEQVGATIIALLTQLESKDNGTKWSSRDLF